MLSLTPPAGVCLSYYRVTTTQEDDASQSIAAAVALADALEGPLSSSLRVLQLYRVFVGPCVAATALARALHRVRQLEILHLEGSELGTPGVQVCEPPSTTSASAGHPACIASVHQLLRLTA